MTNDLLTFLRALDHDFLVWAVGTTWPRSWFSDLVYFSAQYLIFVLPLILLVLWLLPEHRRGKHGPRKAVMLAVISALIGTALKSLIEVAWTRPRPFISHHDLLSMTFKVDTASFPSGHTMLAFALASSLVFSGYKKVGWPAVGIAVLIGLGRIFSGVHYPSDVVAGAALGVASAWYLHREASIIKRYLPDK